MAEDTPTARQHDAARPSLNDRDLKAGRAHVWAADRACALLTVAGDARLGAADRGAR